MFSAQCLYCKHYKMQKTCEAFPKEIPQEIFDGSFDHSNPYEGDNDIRFEPIKEVDEDDMQAAGLY